MSHSINGSNESGTINGSSSGVTIGIDRSHIMSGTLDNSHINDLPTTIKHLQESDSKHHGGHSSSTDKNASTKIKKDKIIVGGKAHKHIKKDKKSK